MTDLQEPLLPNCQQWDASDIRNGEDSKENDDDENHPSCWMMCFAKVQATPVTEEPVTEGQAVDPVPSTPDDWAWGCCFNVGLSILMPVLLWLQFAMVYGAPNVDNNSSSHNYENQYSISHERISLWWEIQSSIAAFVAAGVLYRQYYCSGGWWRKSLPEIFANTTILLLLVLGPEKEEEELHPGTAIVWALWFLHVSTLFLVVHALVQSCTCIIQIVPHGRHCIHHQHAGDVDDDSTRSHRFLDAESPVDSTLQLDDTSVLLLLVDATVE